MAPSKRYLCNVPIENEERFLNCLSHMNWFEAHEIAENSNLKTQNSIRSKQRLGGEIKASLVPYLLL